MIEHLDGTRETVLYSEHFGMRVYRNCVPEHYPIHWHTAGEIIMPIEHGYTALVNEVEYVLRPGDILIIPSGELHELLAPASGERLILQFDYGLFYNRYGFDSYFTMLRPACLITPARHAELSRSLSALLRDIMEEYFSSSVLREAQAQALLMQFFVQLGRHVMTESSRFPDSSSQKRLKYIDQFLQVCSYIHEHCTEDIQVDELADIAGLSKFHFARLFKQFTGVTYYTYLNRHRIMHAEQLLIDPQISITEVAMSSGFGSLATFNRVFKSYKKCTPTQYKRLQGNPSSMQGASQDGSQAAVRTNQAQPDRVR